MPPKSLACLVLGLLLVSPARGQAPPDKPAEKPAIDPAAQRLIDQLADIDYRKRDEAARRLEAMGEKALPALRAARKHADAEVRLRAADLLGPIETATVLAPRRVTLTLEKKTAAEVLEALAKQTGYKIDTTAGPAAPAKPGGKAEEHYDFKWKDVPFWQALDEVCRAAGCTVQPSYGEPRVLLRAHERYAPYVWQAGAFCATAGGFQQIKTVDFSSSPRAGPEVARWDELTFVLAVHAEPRLPLLGLGEPRVSAAYDDEKNSMVPPAGAGKEPPNQQLFGYRPGRPYYSGRNTTLTAQVSLVRPSAKATSVKLIKGTVPINVLVEQKAEVVTDQLATAKGKKFTVGTTSFSVEDVSETPAKQTQVRLSITEEGGAVGGPNDYTWMNSLWSRLEVHDEKGNKMQSNGGSWGGSGPSHANITLTYPAGGKPSKLVFQVWTTVQSQIGFEFKELPLP